MKSFEERFARLEELSEKIKEGNIPLEEAMTLFEEGMKLSRTLEKELSKIERKVEILINNPRTAEEKPKMELFPELDEGEGEA
jgi:exodeoxyribonuclease VII small subunit